MDSKVRRFSKGRRERAVEVEELPRTRHTKGSEHGRGGCGMRRIQTGGLGQGRV